jgi:pimeloyl-ACP methyl ester carboxylesterase
VLVNVVKSLALGIPLLAMMVAIAALTFRAVVQHGLTREETIKTVYGINEAKYVDVRGAQEWITIRGEDNRRPVILFLHGGPSEANSPFVSFYRAFEHDYVFVQWDQPGAGKTYIKAGRHQPELSLESMSDDGVAVAELLGRELHQRKIILIGQDFGGVLGLRMIKKRPELFSAFVGTGQIVSMLAGQDIQYRYALDHATRSNDTQMLAALKKIGPPPYRTLDQYGDFQKCCRNPFWPAGDVAGIGRLKSALVLSPALSIPEIYGWVRALRIGERKLDALALTMPDLRSTDTRFSVPVFFIQGADDNVTPTELVVDYAAHIQAPAIRVSIIPNAGHFVMWTHAGSFLKKLTADLLTAGAAPPADTADGLT